MIGCNKVYGQHSAGYPTVWGQFNGEFYTMKNRYFILKVKVSHSVVSDSLQPHGLYSPGNSPGQNTEVGSLFPSPGDLPNPGIEPRSPTLLADSLPAEPQNRL